MHYFAGTGVDVGTIVRSTGTDSVPFTYPYANTGRKRDGKRKSLNVIIREREVYGFIFKIGYTGTGRRRIVFQMSVRVREG